MLTRLDAQQIPNDLGGFYDAMIRRATAEYGMLQPLMYRNPAQRARLDRVLELLAGMPRGACLELGCCEGLVTRELASLYDTVDAVEISAEALAHGRPMGNVRYHHADAVTFEPPRRDYDAVLMLELLEHVTDPPALLRRYARLGRYIVATCPITEPMNTVGAFDVSLLGQERRQGDATGHIWYMDWAGFRSWFDDLAITHSEIIGHSGLIVAQL